MYMFVPLYIFVKIVFVLLGRMAYWILKKKLSYRWLAGNCETLLILLATLPYKLNAFARNRVVLRY